MNATLDIDAVLHGVLADPTDTTIIVEVFVPNADVIPAMIAEIPKDTMILFLINNAVLEEEVQPATEHPHARQPSVEDAYYTMLGEQAVLMDFDGTVGVENGVPEGQFPRDYVGEPFGDVIEAIRLVP